MSHAGRIWSMDAWLAARRGKPEPQAASSEYRWPVTLMQALMATVFMAAGIAKLRQSGLAWIFSDQLQNLLLDGYYVGRECRPIWPAGSRNIRCSAGLWPA